MKAMIGNCWLILIGWCLVLNSLEIPGIVLGILGCVYALLYRREVNYWRICAVAMMFHAVSLAFLLSSSIPYYFPKLNVFLTVISLNAAIVNEYLSELKRRQIGWLILMMVFCTLVLSVLIIILPDELYTLFTKRNLFLMEAFIFLPYLIPVLLAYVRSAFHAKVLHTHKERVTSL